MCCRQRRTCLFYGWRQWQEACLLGCPWSKAPHGTPYIYTQEYTHIFAHTYIYVLTNTYTQDPRGVKATVECDSGMNFFLWLTKQHLVAPHKCMHTLYKHIVTHIYLREYTHIYAGPARRKGNSRMWQRHAFFSVTDKKTPHCAPISVQTQCTNTFSHTHIFTCVHIHIHRIRAEKR